jgi:hypothetical protein
VQASLEEVVEERSDEEFPVGDLFKTRIDELRFEIWRRYRDRCGDGCEGFETHELLDEAQRLRDGGCRCRKMDGDSFEELLP